MSIQEWYPGAIGRNRIDLSENWTNVSESTLVINIMWMTLAYQEWSWRQISSRRTGECSSISESSTAYWQSKRIFTCKIWIQESQEKAVEVSHGKFRRGSLCRDTTVKAEGAPELHGCGEDYAAVHRTSWKMSEYFLWCPYKDNSIRGFL